MVFLNKFWKAFSSISIPVIGWLTYTVFAYMNDGRIDHIIVASIMLCAAAIYTSIKMYKANKKVTED